MAPLVPPSLYNGIALNLYTNALKAVTAKVGTEQGTIAFRAWNDNRWHYLEVSDTGVGIPHALHERVFDPLFTTTQSKNDPLGSGMGLGLALVKRGAEAFGGRAELVDPPPEFATCVRIRIPLQTETSRA
ncbi:HAMP domain-containing histidine kinase [Caulobacter sp. RL271]|uniref:histidine kinase n=2 Tax=Caulobacter TaxID=75 RepID=A0ABY5A2Q1_9CAUL|nr:HAMP domain-containing histidine kinase [Caulobacter segnis]